jgi:pre-rRNA-processing protein TSR4
MVLLLQLNGELPERYPGHERRIYVFSCRKASCRRRDGSIRALRGLVVAKNISEFSKEDNGRNEVKLEKKVGPSQNLGDALFSTKTSEPREAKDSANPFSGNANPFSSTSAKNPFSTPPPSGPFSTKSSATQSNVDNEASALPKTFKEALNLNNEQVHLPPPPPEPWPEESSLPAAYPVSYLSEAEYETLEPTPASIPANTRMDMDDEPGSSGGGRKEDKEVFESSMDAAFQKFADRMAQNPEQCIRYEFAGTPLLYSKDDTVGKMLSANRPMPRCQNCGAGRVFEVQLTPHAITELEADEIGLEGMDWGTIIVGVCENDCQERSVGLGEAGYIEEWVGVQWEELTKRG